MALIIDSAPRKDLLSKLREMIINSNQGWSEISTNKENDFKTTVAGTETDGYVFKSEAVTDKNRNMILRMKSQDLTAVSSSTTTQLYFWTASDYIPNITDGSNGSFTNLSTYTTQHFTHTDGMNTPDTLYEVYLDILPHRLFFVIHRKDVGIDSKPSMFYFGYPELETMSEGPNYIMQLIFGSNTAGAVTTQIEMFKAPDGSSFSTVTRLSNYVNLAPNNPNANMEYTMSPIYVGSSTFGILGKVDGIWGLPTNNITNLDELVQGGERYKVFQIRQHTAGSSSITPTFICIKIPQVATV
jgi:hypothetical protein